MFDNKGESLVPGIVHTGKLVVWDGGYETNEYLYACGSASSAILLGIGSRAEKVLDTNGFKYEDHGAEAIFMFEPEDLMTEKEVRAALAGESIYLYTIRPKKEHGWLKNKNPVNNIQDEYKCNTAIPPEDYVQCEIKILDWLKKNKWSLVTTERKTTKRRR